MTSIDLLTNPMNLVVSIFLTFTPLIVLFIPYLFTRRKSDSFLAVLYNRAFIGFIIFYLAYFIFPSFLNSLVPNPNEYLNQEFYPTSSSGEWTTIWRSDEIITVGTIALEIPLLVKYLFGHFANSIVIYLNYPIIILGFVFGISPIVSMLILLYQTWTQKRNEQKPLNRLLKRNSDELKQLQKQAKKASESEYSDKNAAINELQNENEELITQLSQVKTVTQRLGDIQFELESSPFHLVKTRVKEKNWDNERELLKVLIAILPITLFLLMTILRLLGETENPSLLQGTSMGWFLEIYFAYIATFVFSVYLIKASNLSRKGKFLGNQLYVTMVQSLSTVGAFMSGLAVLLFLFEYFDQIFVVLYFIIYFIMVSLFFVLFLDIFEPFSIYLLIKLIESFKSLKVARRRINFSDIAKGTFSGVVIGFLLALTFFTIRVIVVSQFHNIKTVQYETFFWMVQNEGSFIICAAIILFIRRWNWSVFSASLVTYISIMFTCFTIFFWYAGRLYAPFNFPWEPFPSIPLPAETVLIPWPITTVTMVFTGMFGESSLNWLTSVWKAGSFGEYQFILPELHQIPVIWQGEGGQFLGILSIPYSFLHPLAIFLTFGTIMFLARREFLVQTQKGEEKTQYKSIFSSMTRLPSRTELVNKADILLIAASPIKDEETGKLISEAWSNSDKGEIIRNAITGHMQSLAQLSKQTNLQIEEIYEILDTVTYGTGIPFNKIITLWHREFAYSFEEVTIDSLHIMMLDGRAVLSHTFGEESQVEPALVAGLFSAITSFAKEAVRSEQLLKTIDHGDVVLTIEYAKWVFAAIFADSTSTELRKKLGDYLGDFEARYSKTLPKWLGDLDIFYGETDGLDDIFSSG